jgi:hypothetical protein
MGLGVPAVIANATVKPWVLRLVRLGYLAKGVIYTLLGMLAIRVGFGMSGGRLAEPSGVFVDIVRQPFGLVLLTTVGIGIVAYAAYYIVEAIADLRRKGSSWRGRLDRALTIFKAVTYGAIGIQALMFALLGDRPNGNPEDQARTMLQIPFGSLLLALIGIGVAIYGVTQVKMAWDGQVDEDIDAAWVRREARWVLPLGQVGTGARGIVLVLMGIGMALAGARQQPSDADGYRETLKTMASINPWLLAAMGAGLLCFGLYQLCHARYAKLALPR